MLKVKAVMIAGGLILSAPAIASYSSSVDDDGCWDGRNNTGGNCLSNSSRWNGDAFISTMTNNCSHRIYARFCNQREGGRSPDCGATGIGGYSDHNWRTGLYASGRYRARSIGSAVPSKDWVCAGKIDGWNSPLF